MSVRKDKKRGGWIVRVKVNGRDVRRRFKRQDDAKAAEAEIRKSLRAGQEIDANKPKRGEVPRLREIVPDFLDFQAGPNHTRPNKPSTIFELERRIERHLLPTFGDKRVDSITTRDVDAFSARLMQPKSAGGSGLSRNTTANILGALRRMLAVCQRWHYIDTLPKINAAKVRPDKVEGEELFTADETSRFLDNAGTWRPMFLLMVRTGMRVGELLALDWSAVDLDNRRVTIRRAFQRRGGRDFMQTTKSGRTRIVPLARDAHEALSALPSKTGLVFPGDDGKPLSLRVVTRAGQRIARAAKITKHWHPHLMRHTFTSHALMNGVPQRTVQLWGGWATLSMLERYSHLVPDHHDEQIDKLAPPTSDAGGIGGGTAGH